MSEEDQNGFFFSIESNEEESEVSKQSKDGIVLIEEAEDKNCDDPKRKKRKKREKREKVEDQQNFNDFGIDEDGNEDENEDENKDENEDENENEFKNDSFYTLENNLPTINFMGNICQNDEKKDTRIISRKTNRNESNDSSFEESPSLKKVSGNNI